MGQQSVFPLQENFHLAQLHVVFGYPFEERGHHYNEVIVPAHGLALQFTLHATPKLRGRFCRYQHHRPNSSEWWFVGAFCGFVGTPVSAGHIQVNGNTVVDVPRATLMVQPLRCSISSAVALCSVADTFKCRSNTVRLACMFCLRPPYFTTFKWFGSWWGFGCEFDRCVGVDAA